MYKKLIRLFSFALIMLASTAGIAENPHLSRSDGFVLEVPETDFQGQPGYYQNARFHFDQETKVWQLLSVEQSKLLNSIDSVELILTDTIPVQAFVQIKGGYGGCDNLGKHYLKLENNHFTISQYFAYWEPPEEPYACLAIYRYFTTTIALPIYGLEAGTYQYTVNKEFSGNFTLDTENVLP